MICCIHINICGVCGGSIGDAGAGAGDSGCATGTVIIINKHVDFIESKNCMRTTRDCTNDRMK